MIDDAALLGAYARNGDQEAFAELVRLRINLVYSAAVRQTGGDTHLAQDVAQAVFVSLARAAPMLEHRPNLAGWLYTTTRFIAAKAVRSQRRWACREQESQAMKAADQQAKPGPDWERLRPLIDVSMHRLSEGDREAILLRYFEGRTFAEVGRHFNLNENSARMRVERALEKLRVQLERRGVSSAAGALGLALGGNAIMAAPTGLAAAAASASFASTAAGHGIQAAALQLFHSMSMTKLKVTASVTVLALCLAGTAVISREQYRTKLVQAIEAFGRTGQARDLAALADENNRLKSEIHRLTSARSLPAAALQPSAAGAPGAYDPLNALAALAYLQKQNLLDVSRVITLVNPNGTLSQAFIKLFALNNGEADSLQRAIDGARQKLGEMAVAHASVSQDSNGSVVIHVTPFAEGAPVYDELMDTFGATLGPNRYASLLSIGENQITQALNNFGGEDQTLTITPLSAKSPGDPQGYQLTNAYTLGHGDNHSHSNGSHSAADISAQLGAVTKLVPPDFFK